MQGIYTHEEKQAFENCLKGIEDCLKNITKILGFEEPKTALEESGNIIRRQNSCFSHIENEIKKLKYFLDFRENLKLQHIRCNAVSPIIKEDLKK